MAKTNFNMSMKNHPPPAPAQVVSSSCTTPLNHADPIPIPAQVQPSLILGVHNHMKTLGGSRRGRGGV